MERTKRILREPAVLEKIGVKKTKLYAMIAAREFPASFTISGTAKGWLESSVDDWIAERVRAASAKAAA